MKTDRPLWSAGKGALLTICAMFVVSVGLVGCNNAEKSSNETVLAANNHTVDVAKDVAADLKIRTEEVQRRMLAGTLHVTGQIHPEFGKEVDVNTRVAGRVVGTYVTPGQAVKPGQLLATIDSQEISNMEAELIEARSKLEIAKAHEDRERQVYEEQLRRPKGLITAKTMFDQKKIALELAEAEFGRQEDLYREKIASQKAFLIAKGEFAKAKADFEEAKADLAREEGLFKNKGLLKREYQVAQAETARAKQHLNTIKQRLLFLGLTPEMIASVLSDEKIEGVVKLIAPVAGVITHQDVFVGEAVDPGKRAFTITDLTTVAVSADIPEVDMAHVSIGERVKVQVTSFPGETFEGFIHYISAQVNPQTRTVPIRVKLANPSMRLKSNMFAEIDIQEHEHEMLVCSKNAIQQHDGKSEVFVATGKGYESRAIKTGLRTEKYVEVVAGLNEGDKVVTDGALLLKTELAATH